MGCGPPCVRETVAEKARVETERARAVLVVGWEEDWGREGSFRPYVPLTQTQALPTHTRGAI